ncbi:MAG TPA: hypothetical protein PKZ00_06670, partial [Elusimicrobiota bacterium]|nr:hypothetical protein [Elusimicrobiota bacterium]
MVKSAGDLGWTFDVYYQRAGMEMPKNYAGTPSYLVALSKNLRPDGLFVTDDISDSGFLPGRADHVRDFPLEGQEVVVPEDSGREAHYLSARRAKFPQVPVPLRMGGLRDVEGYGWRVHVRRFSEYPPRVAVVSSRGPERGWATPLALFVAVAAALFAAHWGLGDVSQGVALAGGVFLGSLRPAVTDELRVLLDIATDPRRTAAPDRWGPGRWATGQPKTHEIQLAFKPTAGPRERTRMAFFKTSVGGRPFSLALAGLRPGIHRVRFSGDDLWPPLLYLTEPDTDRTWAFSLEPFRAGRARNGSGSAALLADPYGSYAEAVREAPARVRLARWLEDRRKDRNVPAPAGLAVALSISGDARSGGALVDPSTGKRLIRLESRAFVPGPAVLEITGEALRVTQGSATVYFELKDVFRFWGGKMERSPRESLAQARLKESDLATRKLLSRGIGELLDDPAGSPSPRAVQRMEIFNREAGVLLMDGSGVLSVLLSPETSRRLQRADRAHFTVAGFRPGGAYRPRWMAVAHRGPVLILEDAADPQKLHAFALGGLRQAEGGKKKGGLTPLGVFRTMAQVGDAAAFSPLGLLEEAAARAADWAAGAAPDLEARVFAFNLQKPVAKATLNDGQGLYLESPFTGAVRRVRTQSHQNSLWTLSILLTADGPLLLARAVPSKVREPFKAYGPLVFGDALDRPEVAVWRGDREASLSSAAESLSR